MSVKAVALNHLAKRKDLQKILTTADIHTGNWQASPDGLHARSEPDNSLETQVSNHTDKVQTFTRTIGRIISHIEKTQSTNIHLAV